MATATNGLVELVALAQSSGFLASSCQATHFSVLVDRVDNPVDARIAANGSMRGVDQNNFVELVCGILVDPVAVQDS